MEFAAPQLLLYRTPLSATGEGCLRFWSGTVRVRFPAIWNDRQKEGTVSTSVLRFLSITLTCPSGDRDVTELRVNNSASDALVWNKWRPDVRSSALSSKLPLTSLKQWYVATNWNSYLFQVKSQYRTDGRTDGQTGKTHNAPFQDGRITNGCPRSEKVSWNKTVYILLLGEIVFCGASDAVYNYIFLRNVVCQSACRLSDSCALRKPFNRFGCHFLQVHDRIDSAFHQIAVVIIIITVNSSLSYRRSREWCGSRSVMTTATRLRLPTTTIRQWSWVWWHRSQAESDDNCRRRTDDFRPNTTSLHRSTTTRKSLPKNHLNHN